MYFPKSNMIVSRLPPEGAFVSLAASVDFLNLIKVHCTVPVDEAITELDETLKLYCDTAEQFIDKYTNTPCRQASYELRLCNTIAFDGQTPRRPVDVFGSRFQAVYIPHGPIDPDELVVTFTDDDGDVTVLVPNTDYELVGERTSKPEIVFLPAMSWPSGSHPYPYTIEYTTANTEPTPIHKTAILLLICYYHRNPEGLGDEVPNAGSSFWALVNSMRINFL